MTGITNTSSTTAQSEYNEDIYLHGLFEDYTEDREEYRPGGFHPVQLGDHIAENNNQRYRAIGKLGYGGVATVWLCRDNETQAYVALKIIMARESSPYCPELSFLNRDLDFTQPGGSQISLPLRHFWFAGPNGFHLCLVLSVLGPAVDVIWDKFPNPSKISRSIALQIGNGLQFLHRNGIVHGDFRPSNILLRLSGFDALSEEQLATKLGEPQIEELLTISGESLNPSAPKYIVRPWNLMKLNSRHFTTEPCIIDFGESCDLSNPPESLGIPSAYRSPELIFDNSVGIGCDIWAFACTVFEIRVLWKLFGGLADDNGAIIEMVQTLGKLPEPWWSAWEGRERRYHQDGTPKGKNKPVSIQELLDEKESYSPTTKKKVDVGISPEERDMLADLLLQMLKYDPGPRISVETALGHPWFRL